MGSPFLLPLSCRHSKIMNYIKQLMGRCFQQYLRLCLSKYHSLCHEFRSAGPTCRGWVLSLTRNLGSMATKTGAAVVMRKGKVIDVMPSIRNIPGKDKVSSPQAVDTASSHGPVPACLMQTGAGCARGLSSCAHHSELLQLLGWHHALQPFSMETGRLPMVTHVQVNARKGKTCSVLAVPVQIVSVGEDTSLEAWGWRTAHLQAGL